MEQVLGMLKPLLESYAGLMPKALIGFLALVGSFRIVMKPALAFVHSFVEATPSKKDDAALKKFEEGKMFKYGKIFLNWIFSIKWPAKK